MISALVVANKIIELCNNNQIEVNHLKLQKLLYFVQDAYFKNHGELLFESRIEAWKLGPVVVDIYHLFKGYGPTSIPNNNIHQTPTNSLNPTQLDIIQNVVKKLGVKTPKELIDITHDPKERWINFYDDNDQGREIIFEQQK